jgi:GTP-binding protein EngB required for normal cell division
MDESQLFDELYEKRKPSDNPLNIAVVGKVSAGKSSLINAILECEFGAETIAPVGATSGVTTKVTPSD